MLIGPCTCTAPTVMATSVSHEELIKHQDHIVWPVNGGLVDEEPIKAPCERLWELLNSRPVSVLVVTLTVVEGLVILAELLIDLNIVQDPWNPCNCSSNQNAGNSTNSGRSHNLDLTKKAFSYASISILALFLFEVLLRILSGKGKFFTQIMEFFDAVVVFTAFAVDLAFFILHDSSPGKEAAVLIILLRLWRIKRIIHSVIRNIKRQMSHIINAYKRDKIQAEHKVELLILKVEDLEHEVAFLKEKLKKVERDALPKKKKNKDASQLAEFAAPPDMDLVHNHSLPSQRLPPEGRTESPHRDQDMSDLQRFAETTVNAILQTATDELSHRGQCRSKRRLPACDGASFSQQDVARRSLRGGDILNGKYSPRKSRGIQEELDELSEIERIKNIQFDPNRENGVIPVTAL